MGVEKQRNGNCDFIGVFENVNFSRFLNERRNAMKKMLITMLVVGLIGFGSAQATMLDDFEDGAQNWAAIQGSPVLSNVTTDAYLGSRSLEIADSSAGSPYISSHENHGDLSSLKGTYVEFAVKSPALSNGIAGNTALHFYIGSDASNRSCWSISEADFQSVPADANGWWVIHLELDASGNAIFAGSTINGTAITDNDYANTWQIGSPNWNAIAFTELILLQGSGSSVATYYFDELAIGQAIPEPATIGLLLMGIVGLIRRR